MKFGDGQRAPHGSTQVGPGVSLRQGICAGNTVKCLQESAMVEAQNLTVRLEKGLIEKIEKEA